MISKKQFDRDESLYNCGYWSVCYDHACPCAITTENKEYSEEIYRSLKEEADECEDWDYVENDWLND